MPENKRIENWLRADGLAQPLLAITSSTDIHELVSDSTLKTSELIEVPGEGKLTIKMVRSLLTKLETTVIQDRRLIFIPAAERLLPAASNALLKILEEAGAKNRFLLTTAYPGRLLATIRSRCEILRLGSPPILRGSAVGVVIPHFDPKRKLSVTSEEAAAIATLLQQKLTTGGNTPAVHRSLGRLRDFYKAHAVGAGEKLASDALLASLIELKN